MKTKHSIRNLKNLRILISLTSLISLTTATAQTYNIRADFSCSGQVTVTYDLAVDCPSRADVALYYSPNNRDWAPATTVSGAGSLPGQSTGKNKEIIWDSDADNVKFGKFYFKVESSPSCPAGGVIFDCVCWATSNLDEGGVFAANDYDMGALYQWGRQADGHESRTSANYPTDDLTLENGAVSGADLVGGQVASTSGAYGKFIKQMNAPYDWRTPQDDKLWNSGTEEKPEKNTAADPCPAGWRVPTYFELSKLNSPNVTRVWKTDYKGDGSNIKGHLLTDATLSSIFLPAACKRESSNGQVYTWDEGYYWSSRIYSNDYAYYLNIYSSTLFSMNYNGRARGYSIRCVAE